MVNGVIIDSTGVNLSPLLSNIMFNELDKELEKLKVSFRTLR